MVKGTAKRVVVVKSPDPKIFEQAIFIVREDYSGGKGPADVLRQAQQVADDYIRGSVQGRKRLLSRIPPPAFAAAGAGCAGLVWLTLHILGL